MNKLSLKSQQKGHSFVSPIIYMDIIIITSVISS